jgi:hypothetical protein
MFRRRRRPPVFLSAWLDAGSYTVVGRVAGAAFTETVPFGIGETHAVPRDGDRYMAVCGQCMRMWSRRRFDPRREAEVCSDCERLTVEIASLSADLAHL